MSDFRLIPNADLRGIASAGNKFSKVEHAVSVAKSRKGIEVIVEKDGLYSLYEPLGKDTANIKTLAKQSDLKILKLVDANNTVTNIKKETPSVDNSTPTNASKNIAPKFSYSSVINTPNKNIAYTSNTKIMLNDKEFKISGLNVYDLANVSDGSQQELEKTLKTIADSGANTVRFWAFSSHNPDTFANIFDTSKKMGLDLKFIPVLGNQWKDMEATAGNFTKKDDWYKQGYKKDYLPHALETVRSMINRDEVLMIELMNEPEANHSALKNFANTVSTAIKNEYKEYEKQTGNKTAKHLISLGTLGGEGRNGMAGSDYKDLYSLPNIDVVTAHDYSLDDKQSKENTIAPIFKEYINTAKQLNKPFFVGEIGVKVRKDGVENFGMPIRTNEKALEIMDKKMKLYNDKNISGVLLWGPQPAGHGVDGAGYGFSYSNGDKTQNALRKIFSEIHP